MKQELTLLYVEDDVHYREVLCQALGKELPVETASNGREALKILRDNRNKAYLVLLDLNMPVMNGHEFLQELRESKTDNIHRSVVFVLSTSESKTDIEKAYSRYIAGYILKGELDPPFTKIRKLISDYKSAVRLPH